jgi:hypothetical protein
MCWLFFARSLPVVTTMFGCTLRQQLGASVRSPAISTTQGAAVAVGR